MDGLGRAVGAGVPMEFGGEMVVLDPLRIEDFGLVEQHLLSKRESPLTVGQRQAEELLGKAADFQRQTAKQPANDAEKLAMMAQIERAQLLQQFYLELAKDVLTKSRSEARKENTVPPQEVVAWIGTIDGLVFTIWLKLHQRYPGKFSLERVREIVLAKTEEELAQLARLRDQASGIDDLGNSTGPTRTETAPTVGHPTGVPSSATSPSRIITSTPTL